MRPPRALPTAHFERNHMPATYETMHKMALQNWVISTIAKQVRIVKNPFASDRKNPVSTEALYKMLIAQRLRDLLNRGSWRC
jgi:hypothetical protein